MGLLYFGSQADFLLIAETLTSLQDSSPGRYAGTIDELESVCAANKPGVIVVGLPLGSGVSGDQLRHCAAAHSASLLAIILDAAADVSTELAALNPQAQGYIAQPAQLRQIAALVIENRDLRRQAQQRASAPDVPAHTQVPTETFTYKLNAFGCISDADDAAARATGRVEAFRRSFVQLLHPGDIPKFAAALKRLRKSDAPAVAAAFRFRHFYGHYLWVDAEISAICDDESELAISLRCTGMFGMQEAHLELLRMNRLHAIVNTLRQYLTAVTDEESLFGETCRIAASDDSFRMAYITLLDDEKTLRLAAQHGLPQSVLPLIETHVIAEHDLLHKVLVTNGNVICNDIQAEHPQQFWKPIAAAHGVNSFIILPLRKAHKFAGVMVLASDTRGFFNDQEIALLTEVAADISLKLDFFETERGRREAELHLAHSERRLREAQQIAHLGSWEVDFRSGVALWSEECLRIYGLPPEATQQSYQVWISHIHPDDLKYVLGITTEASRNCTPSILDHRIVRADGVVRHLHSEAHFIFDEANKPIGLSGIALDITDIKEKELRLQESEQRYSTLFYNCPQPMWLYDPESFRFVQVNRAATEKYGYSKAEFCEMTIFDIRPEEDRDRVIEFAKTPAMEIPAPEERIFRHRKRSGEIMEVEIYSNTVVLNDREYRLVMAVDVTAINMHEDRMTSAIIQAQENERYEIGAELHDNICQILAASLMRLAMLKNGSSANPAEDYERVVLKIRRAIKEVRSLSHRLAPASFNESTLSDSLSELVSTYNNTEHLHVELFFSPEIDERSISQELKLNIYRILQEQLSNIVKHAKASEVLIRVDQSKTHLKLLVSDNGSGFDPENHKSGIGLTNMKRRVDLFRGVLDVLTAPGHGCKLRVQIPFSHPSAQPGMALPINAGLQAV